ncbi:ATP-binding protein [Desulfurispirillum indicum]|uniref:ATP-binding protein n=1 Tax=Desulfurispirillum indicum TaxID=936456 RepID=UPI001CFB5FE7|nr:ATP-binding protein [Desulfurispirillum indicum]UCZ56237.1 ATP-binding protein [Desulfurispirillum indicum]
MPHSPELAGGEGFTFEGDAAAFYLTALLAEAYAPGIDDRTVVRVSVQQRDFGEPLDDVIVDFEEAAKNPARLSLQVKRSLTISDAKTNTDFRDIIRDSWATLKKSDFRINADRYGAAVGTVTPAKERALRTLCDWARESLTADHFDARFAQGGSASEDIKAVKNDVVALLEETKRAPCTGEEVHRFLAHFVLIQFDFLREGATDPPDAINRIRDCLAPDDAAKAPLVWSKVVQLARASAGKSGQFDRARLVQLISPVARLRGAPSLRLDLDKLTELAKSYANLIPDDVGGTKLDRALLLDKLDAKLTTSRVVQIRGLPGSGKSVVVRRAVQRALDRGPILFLKAEQLEGTNWSSYATSQGLSGASLEQLLVEVGAVGTPILFIDAIDRIEKEHQPVIIDVIRTIVDSPLLDNWRIIVSLRDTGIEVLRNWLGDFLDVLKVETLSVDQLCDEEAETLAKAKPHLRPLLFGPAQVQEIVRRPFFAKVLNQNYVADPKAPTFAPQSEIDLIENWWRRGGYNETGQGAIERQRALLDLARIRARQLSQPIRISQLTSVAHIDDLRSDGILQNAREGISVRFAHDIFFEWAFFYVLADRGPQWIEEIKTCGEPPAVARVVELVSQWEYAQGEDWPTYLAQTEGSDLRSQWLRAWLIGPLGTARFEADEGQFATAVFADDFRLFRKVLVWFQAEKTSPNASILAGTLPQEQRQRFADLLGWPSDFAAWRRLIGFILRRVSDIPQRLYPEVVAIFEVWQNALAELRNPTSCALLQQCAIWLAAIDAISTADGPDENSEYWARVPDLGAFRKSLGQLLLRSSRAEPTLAADYLQRVVALERIRDDAFHDIIAYSPVLAQSLPQSIVELSLVFLREELPDEQVAREKQELRAASEWRKAILAKPEAERTRKQQMALSFGVSLRTVGDFSYHDWERLSIHDDYRSFSPPSPLREPFHSLFQSSPDEALRLFRELCNHAMTAWRQLHRYSRDRDGTPIPLELTFPWGTQKFWGTDREYLWFRSTWAPNAIGCGFMALEEWCFAELERNRSVDELIQRIVEGNECIAILGVASMLALHTETVSEGTLPLFTSQRLLAADHNRMAQDFSSTANLIGFTQRTDMPHVEAIQAANARPVRKTQLSWMVPRFIFEPGPISDQAREAILNFKNDLPFQYEEHRDIPEAREDLTKQALEYAELADTENYQAYRTEEGSDQIAIVHVSPSATEPENVARAEEATKYLRLTGLWTWASKSFEEKTLNDTYTIEDAIVLSKEADARDLFEHPGSENEEEQLGMRRGAVAATAAIVLNFREGCTHEDLEWARGVLGRAIRLPEKFDLMWSPSSVVPWHQGIYVARGLAADLREGTAARGATRDLLGLIAHPLEVVSLAALEEACKLWPKDSKLTWAALILAFSLCHVPSRPRDQPRQHGEAIHTSNEAQAAVNAALAFYEYGRGWAPLPLPPPAWVKVEPGKGRRGHQRYEDYDLDDATDAAEVWGEPDVFWHSKQAAEVLQRIPFDEVINSSAKSVLLDFLASVLDWTNQKNAPPWVKPGRRDRSATQIFEWTHTLGSRLGHVAGLIPLADFQARFLDPILGLEGDNCWALLSPLASTYVCAYLYDAPVVPADAVATLDLCLGRLLQAPAFMRDTYRSGEFSGFHQPKLVRTLMFVSVERADLAARYVNGDWSEISRILPLIDRFIRAGGWAASVMAPFLTLCERARGNYPAEAFADQVLAIISDGPDNLKGWHGTFIPARIAELVQHFAHRDAPMTLAIAQKFLRILDMLVDMGDRRSAALQLGEAFREVRLPS